MRCVSWGCSEDHQGSNMPSPWHKSAPKGKQRENDIEFINIFGITWEFVKQNRYSQNKENPNPKS